MHIVAERPVMTLEAAIERVSRLVGQRIDWATIESFLPEDATGGFRKSALASSFLAAPELARRGEEEFRPQQAFAPLYGRGTSRTRPTTGLARSRRCWSRPRGPSRSTRPGGRRAARLLCGGRGAAARP